MGSKGHTSKTRVTKTLPAWVFAFLWVLASSSYSATIYYSALFPGLLIRRWPFILNLQSAGSYFALSELYLETCICSKHRRLLWLSTAPEINIAVCSATIQMKFRFLCDALRTGFCKLTAHLGKHSFTVYPSIPSSFTHNGSSLSICFNSMLLSVSLLPVFIFLTHLLTHFSRQFLPARYGMPKGYLCSVNVTFFHILLAVPLKTNYLRMYMIDLHQIFTIGA